MPLSSRSTRGQLRTNTWTHWVLLTAELGRGEPKTWSLPDPASNPNPSTTSCVACVRCHSVSEPHFALDRGRMRVFIQSVKTRLAHSRPSANGSEDIPLPDSSHGRGAPCTLSF